MPFHHFLDEYINYLEDKNQETSFLSNTFIALRNLNTKKSYDRESCIEYLNTYKGIIDKLSFSKEDSHFLVYFNYQGKRIIQKVRFDTQNKIQSIVEDYFDERNEKTILFVEYDGSCYFGMQRLNGDSNPTIQSTIEKALFDMTGFDIKIRFASRTDRGVHATNQVIEFVSPSNISYERYCPNLNDFLPKDIIIKGVEKRSQLFDSRFDVIEKTYVYLINTSKYSVFLKNYNFFYHFKNLEKFKAELNSIVGTNDFFSFQKGHNDGTVRTISKIEVKEEGNLVKIFITSNGFLRNMIRFIVGSAIKIDKEEKGSLKEIMLAKDKNKTPYLIGPQGLYLIDIRY